MEKELLRAILETESIKDTNKRNLRIEEISEMFGFPYRTVRGFIRIKEREGEKYLGKLARYISPGVYTEENMVKAYEEGDEDIIPAAFYESDSFLLRTGIERLPDYFASGNENLYGFKVSPLIKEIGEHAFDGCSNLKEIFFLKRDEGDPHQIRIHNGAFKGCTKLDAIELPDDCSFDGEDIFAESGLVKLNIPDSVEVIPRGMFRYCENLKEISFRANSPIMTSAFEGCKNLRVVKAVPGSVEERSFKGCVKLSDIDVAASKIGEEAFADCKSLKTICYWNIPYTIEKNAFRGCSQELKTAYRPTGMRDDFVRMLRYAISSSLGDSVPASRPVIKVAVGKVDADAACTERAVRELKEIIRGDLKKNPRKVGKEGEWKDAGTFSIEPKIPDDTSLGILIS